MNSNEQIIQEAIWFAHHLFATGHVKGSTGNISVRIDNEVYISASGSIFGRLEEKDFSIIDMDGNIINGIKPSKEFPLHLSVYRNHPEYSAVIHTHSFYSVLWSCLFNQNEKKFYIPRFTPYLAMKADPVCYVAYAQPGSKELFAQFETVAAAGKAWVLGNHGVVAGGKTVSDAYAIAEELEESCRLAWHVRNESGIEKIMIF